MKRVVHDLAARLADLAAPGRRTVSALTPAMAALLAWALRRAAPARGVFVVADGARALERLHQDLCTLAPQPDADGERPVFLPPWEPPAAPGETDDPDLAAQRLLALPALASPCVAATSIQALMQKTLPPDELRDRTLRLAVGCDLDRDAITARLARNGYRPAPQVQARGEICARGGLLDVWPPAEPWPLRLELFGPVIESIRAFDPATQRSRERIASLAVPPAGEWGLADRDRAAAVPVIEYAPGDAIFLRLNPASAREHARMYEESCAESGLRAMTLTLSEVEERLAARPRATQIVAGTEPGVDDPADAAPLPFEAIDAKTEPERRLVHPDIREQRRKRLVTDMIARAAAGKQVIVFLETQGARDHFVKTLPAEAGNLIEVRVGALSGGFVSESLGVCVLAEPDLYGQREPAGRRYDPLRRAGAADAAVGARIESLKDLQPGDLVVHIEHGLGRYLGLFDITFNGQRQEVLSIEYAEGAKLHVPVSHAHLLSRYVGIAGHRAELHKLGGRRWSREKTAAEEAVADLAASLLETQAHRDLLQGFAFPADTVWQHEFETSFLYRETPDQTAVIDQVREDMQSPRPMDRLVCGDAGYGKTEVAMRAAFRAVMAGRQVAVLVPTTILAQQHHETFSARMAPYPVRIEVLSRFRTGGERQKILRDMAEGAVDIVIGTHALLQPGVRFRNLGLVVIDEEQRFGVRHKERLKEMRRLVDVLTLTATPIPRTLYMSLTGARNVSLLQTPPRERVAIETIVTRNRDDVVRQAILREVSRDGQVFYLYNRVLTIGMARERLAALVPEVRIGTAHGQMSTGELESVMQRFLAGEFDVLLCTTIIESGVDIPRVNTILIDRADRFGLADLYQLRGRVGRSNRKAYAYFLLPDKAQLDAVARERLAAIQRHSGVGAGFDIAMRDLEIRGAGNLLGSQQSGHIAAVGFGLYCQLLRRSIARLQGKPLPPVVDVEMSLDFIGLSSISPDDASAATIPYTYIEDEQLRVDAYRRIAETVSAEEVRALTAELRDRFGAVPPPVARLLKTAAIRVAAAAAGIVSIEARDDKLMLRDGNDYIMRDKRHPRLSGRTPNEKLDEILDLVHRARKWAR